MRDVAGSPADENGVRSRAWIAGRRGRGAGYHTRAAADVSMAVSEA